MADIMERQSRRTQRMWWKLGTLCEDIALDVICLDDTPDRAVLYAQCAEACYFQATGEGDYKPLREFNADD